MFPERLFTALPNTFSDGGWHHLAATWQPGSMAIFVDGVEVARRSSISGSINPATSTPFMIGGEHNSPFPFIGSIDEVMLFNRVITSGEIAGCAPPGAGDTTPPTSSAETAPTASLFSTQARLNWTTNELASTQIEYGLTTAYGSASALDPMMTLAHSQVITGLLPGRVYHYRTVSRDAAGNVGRSANRTFTTPAGTATVNSRGFEGVTNGFAAWYGATVATSTLQKRSGTASLQITTSAAGSGVMDSAVPRMAVVAGTHYTVSLWVRAASTSAPVSLVGFWNNNAGGYLGDAYFPASVTASSTTWTELKGSVVAPPGATTLTIGLRVGNSAAGQVFYADDYSVVSAPAVVTPVVAKTFNAGVDGMALSSGAVAVGVTAYGANSGLQVSFPSGTPSAWTLSETGTGTAVTSTARYQLSGWASRGSGQLLADLVWLNSAGGVVRTDRVAMAQLSGGGVSFGSSLVAPPTGAVRVRVVLSASADGVAAWLIDDVRVSSVVVGGGVSDTVAPTVSGVTVSAVGPSQVTVSWSASEVAASQVEFGTSSAYAATTGVVSGSSVMVSGLLPGRTYQFRVVARDAVGNVGRSLNGSFTTVADTVGPVVSGVTVSGVGMSSAVVGWATDEPGSSYVQFGMSTAYGSASAIDAVRGTVHARSLSGLAPGTTYQFRVVSVDAVGNVTRSVNGSFTTLPRDWVAPVVSGVRVSGVGMSSAVVGWVTDEPGSSYVEFGTSTEYGSGSATDAVRGTVHARSLSGLAPGTTYQFRVVSVDAAGNERRSVNGSFTTLPVASGAVSSMWFWPGGQRALLVESGSVTLSFGGLAERSASAAGVVERRWFSVGGTVAGVQQRSAVGVVSWSTVLGDVRGSVAVTVPRGSSVVTSNWWAPFGARRGVRVDTVGTRGYLGQAEDVGSGLTYLNNRYYDPTVGVFLSVDPLVNKTGDPYLYAAGNPTTLSDPSGLDPGWAHDSNPCNDAGYYTCGQHDGGPNRGGSYVNGYGARATAEFQRGVGTPRLDVLLGGQEFLYDKEFFLFPDDNGGARDWMARMQQSPQSYFPFTLKLAQCAGGGRSCSPMEVGNLLWLSGGSPDWLGHVRVIDVTDTSFSFLALEDHEAGRGGTITFSMFEREYADGSDVYLRMDATYDPNGKWNLEQLSPDLVTEFFTQISWSTMVAAFRCENAYVGQEQFRRC
jgi:RHS repeat-associated protein